VEFSSNLSAIYTKWCAQTFPSIFDNFEIFDRNFAKIVAPPSDECENYLVRLKEQSLVKKRCKPRRNRAINSNGMLFRTMHPLNAWCSGHGAWQKNKLETKASSHEGQCIPAGSNVSLPRRLLITVSIITMRSRIFAANSASDSLRFVKFGPQFSESCGATYRRICEMFSAHLVL